MPSRTYFHFYKKGFLNSQAVRIRVKAEKMHFQEKKIRFLKCSRPVATVAMAALNPDYFKKMFH
jgi:hypothetical protein